MLKYLKDEDPKNCITKQVDLGELFFFSLKRYLKGKVEETCGCIGFLSLEEDGTYVLNVEKIVEGSKIFVLDHHRIVVTGYYPTSNFFNGEFSASLLTSDGVITLDADHFIGVKDGKIDELSAEEVLSVLSSYGTEKSPSYSSLRLNPVSKKPSRPRKGTVIYNKTTDNVEVFNGKEWRDL